MKKKAKAKQALLEKQIKDLEELEEREARMSLACCNLSEDTPGSGTGTSVVHLVLGTHIFAVRLFGTMLTAVDRPPCHVILASLT